MMTMATKQSGSAQKQSATWHSNAKRLFDFDSKSIGQGAFAIRIRLRMIGWKTHLVSDCRSSDFKRPASRLKDNAFSHVPQFCEQHVGTGKSHVTA
jgi:hypothetical protein